MVHGPLVVAHLLLQDLPQLEVEGALLRLGGGPVQAQLVEVDQHLPL